MGQKIIKTKTGTTIKNVGLDLEPIGLWEKQTKWQEWHKVERLHQQDHRRVQLQKNFSSTVATSSRNKDNLLIYSFTFNHSNHWLFLDTGAERSLLAKKFVKQHNLPQVRSKIWNLILAYQSWVMVVREVEPLSINLGHLVTKIRD